MQRVIALLLLASAVAGCADSPDAPDADGTDIPSPSALAGSAPVVDAGALLGDLSSYAQQFNVRAGNVPQHEGARQWMLQEFESYGLETYRQDYSTSSLSDQANIIGIKWGAVRDQWVVVSAHYDTMTDDCLLGTGTPAVGPAPSVEHGCPLRQGSQGAYDDGSGTMMVMHLAKAFASLNTTYTMAFVALDGEELGTQGARAFVDAFVTGYQEQNFTTQPFGQIKLVGAVDLDMIGLNWPGVNNPINVLTNSEVLWAETLNVTGPMGIPDEQLIRKEGLKLGSSDYARFWEVTEEHGGPIPTIFFIAGFEEVGLPAPAPSQAHTPTSPVDLVPLGIYPFWHFFDTMETMTAMAGGEANLEAGFQTAVDIAAHLLWKLAADPGLQPDAVPK